jgi:hypothetical protein
MEVIPAVAEPAGAKPGEYPWPGAIGIFSYLAPMGKLPLGHLEKSKRQLITA